MTAVNLTGITFEQPVELAGMSQAYDPISACQMEHLLYSVDAPDDPCPHWQYNPRGPDRSTQPQPGAEGTCTTCPYDPDGFVLYIQIDKDFVGEVEGGVLKCGDQTWSLGLETMVANETAQVNGIDCLGAEPILLSFKVNDGTSSTSSILAIEP
jgi:hypothetical protein